MTFRIFSHKVFIKTKYPAGQFETVKTRALLLLWTTCLILTMMNYLIALLIFGLCFLGMAVGLIFAKKALQKGCSTDPDSCTCRKENKDPSNCDQ